MKVVVVCALFYEKKTLKIEPRNNGLQGIRKSYQSRVDFYYCQKTSNAGQNIIAGGWAGASNPQPRPNPTPQPPSHTLTYTQ